MRYIGICIDTGAWGKDLTGSLVAETKDGWKVVGSWISSNESWSRVDIGDLFEKKKRPGDTFEWKGLVTREAAKEMFGW